MTVKELIADLSEMNPEAKVMLQYDTEGNGYSPLAGADHNAIWSKKNATMYDLAWTAQDGCLGEEEWEKIKKTMPKCVVLFPGYEE